MNIKADDIKKSNQSKKKRSKKMKQNLLKLYKDAEDVDVIVEFNQNIAKYELLDKLEIDPGAKLNFTKLMAGGERKYYTTKELWNYTNRELDCKLLGECFLVQNPLPEWEITQETKLIGGYLCYKAIHKNSKNTKMKPVAWFTPKIPLSYGIMKYYGLPGMILKLETHSITFTAKKIELNPKKKIKLTEPKKAKKISRKEYQKILKKSFPEFQTN